MTDRLSATHWQAVVEAHHVFCNELAEFVRGWNQESEQIVRDGLRSNLLVALAVIRTLPIERAIRLLPDLLYYARSVHGHLAEVRETILSIPKDWLIRDIEKAANPLLSAGDDEDYRRFLELYLRIDSDLALRLATTAAKANDPYIRDVGQEFLQKLSK